MYLHLGQNTVIRMADIIGVFDLDTSTISKHTKNFLRHAQNNNNVVNITNELPKSFILSSQKCEKKQEVLISQIASATIKKRSEKPYVVD